MKKEIMCEISLSENKKIELTSLLAEATTAYDSFKPNDLDIIVTIGKGMFWSKELDKEARALATKIQDEFNRIAAIAE